MYYHVWFVTKYRKATLVGEINKKIKTVFAECIERHNFKVLEYETNRDHAHLLVKVTDKEDLASLVRVLKCVSAKAIGETPHFWARRYGSRIVRQNEIENMQKYIRNQSITPHSRVREYNPTLPSGECKKPHAEACGEHLTPKSFFIKTFGCQMNTRDSELVAGLLIKKGYTLVDNSKDADVILFNACSVRQHAEDKVWSQIKQLVKAHELISSSKKAKSHKLLAKSYGRKPIFGLIGCMAQNYQQAAFDKEPMLDLVVGPNNIDAIPSLIEMVRKEKSVGLAVGKRERDAFVYNTEYVSKKTHCSVIISEGCNNLCSYCVVPYVRGMERSRAAESILDEIKGLVEKGVTEITLLGQNVNSYRYSQQSTVNSPQIKKQKKDDCLTVDHGQSTVDFIGLLKMVNAIEGVKSFDFITSHPKDASVELFYAIRDLEKLNKYLHLPVQSGSDRILSLMNRGYNRSHYIELAKKAKEIIPGLRLTTDVMLGFPTETEEDFQDTFDLMKEVEFDAAYIFKYSPRPHTKAAEVKDDVALKVKEKRSHIILEFQRNLHHKKKEEINGGKTKI